MISPGSSVRPMISPGLQSAIISVHTYGDDVMYSCTSHCTITLECQMGVRNENLNTLQLWHGWNDTCYRACITRWTILWNHQWDQSLESPNEPFFWVSKQTILQSHQTDYSFESPNRPFFQVTKWTILWNHQTAIFGLTKHQSVDSPNTILWTHQTPVIGLTKGTSHWNLKAYADDIVVL